MSFTDATREAYAANPADNYIIETLEFVHPAFVGAGGLPTSIRVALDDRDWDLELEAAAPLDGGATVTFEALAIRVTLPEQEEGVLGEMRIAIDNVPGTYVRHLDAAIGIRATALLIYREWIATHNPETGEYTVSGPPDHILADMTIKSVTMSRTTIEAVATFHDLLNTGFPRLRFTREQFPALF